MMQQNDDNNRDLTNKAKTSSEKKIEDMEDWRNEHGQPSSKFLQSLAKDGGPEALEKLRSIATDLDVEYGPNTSTNELIGKILSATQSDPRTTT
ncbi:hypothetical protein ACFL0Y_02025 [Patescibacteria group bacterium]